MKPVRSMEVGWHKHASDWPDKHLYFHHSGEVLKNGNLNGTLVDKPLGSRKAPKAKRASVGHMDRDFWRPIPEGDVPEDVRKHGPSKNESLLGDLRKILIE